MKDQRKNRWADTRRIVKVQSIKVPNGKLYLIELECGHTRTRRSAYGYPVAAMRCTTCSPVPVSPLVR